MLETDKMHVSRLGIDQVGKTADHTRRDVDHFGEVESGLLIRWRTDLDAEAKAV